MLIFKAIKTCGAGRRAAGLAGAIIAVTVFSLRIEAQMGIPEVIQDVRVVHGKLFTDEECVRIFTGARIHPLPLDSLRHGALRILQAYGEYGYPFARIDSIQLERVNVGVIAKLHITQGGPLRIESVAFHGNTEFEAEHLGRLFGLKPGVVWEERRLHEGLSRIEEEYSFAGYPFCRAWAADTVAIDAADESEGSLPLAVIIDEGRQGRADSILFRGNSYTRRSILERQTGIARGSILNRRRLEAAERNLNRLPFLERVSGPQWVLLPGEGTGILFDVTEGASNNFSGILGYLPSPGRGGTGIVTGDVSVHFGNLFGTARSITGRWARRDAYSQDFDFRYHEPWLLGGPVSLDIFLGQAIQDSSYIKRVLGVEAGFAVSQSLSLNAAVERYSTNPENYGRETYGLEPFGVIEGKFGFTYDTRDFPQNPQRGAYHRLLVSIGRRKGVVSNEEPAEGGTVERGTILDRSVITDFIFAYPIAYRHVAYFGFHGSQMETGGKEIPYSRWFAMGGARSLRGYREQQFRSTTVGWWNIEYRILPERRSRIFTFFDAGFYRSNPEAEGAWLWKYGYGLGFRVNSRLGIIGMDYGIGQDDGFSNGKIHLSIENRF